MWGYFGRSGAPLLTAIHRKNRKTCTMRSTRRMRRARPPCLTSLTVLPACANKKDVLSIAVQSRWTSWLYGMDSAMETVARVSSLDGSKEQVHRD